MNPKQVVEARKHVRRFRRGVIRMGDEICQSSFVIDGRDGRIVMPCDEDLSGADDLVLYVPDDGFNEMALLLSASPHEDEFDEAKDRHLAYHGRACACSWYRCEVDSAKWSGEMFEGADLLGPNTIRSVEPALCKRLNADREVLARMSELLTRVRPESPLCVGVDQLGMDVRTRVGVMRVEWPAEITSPEEAEGVVGALLTGAA